MPKGIRFDLQSLGFALHGIGFGLQGIRFAWEPIPPQGLPCLANVISLTPLGCDFVYSFRSAILISHHPEPIRWYLVSNSFVTCFSSVYVIKQKACLWFVLGHSGSSIL